MNTMIDETHELRVQVVICYNKSSNFSRTFAHELMHFYDRCRGNEETCDLTEMSIMEWRNCECSKRLCQEYRAFFISGECTDADSCWERIMEKNFAGGTESYWEHYGCDKVGTGPADKAAVKARLETSCSLTDNMPPTPDF